jgi:hypothetical protein
MSGLGLPDYAPTLREIEGEELNFLRNANHALTNALVELCNALATVTTGQFLEFVAGEANKSMNAQRLSNSYAEARAAIRGWTNKVPV